jgi:cell division inhibitor SepF
VQGNARDWLGFAKHDNDAIVDDGYMSEGFTGVDDEDEVPGDQLAMDNGIHIAIVRPRNFRDAATVGEYYRQEVPVIINLEDMEKVDATRIIDFVSGLILGLGGDLERISRRTFLIVPADATIITTHEGLTEEGFFNQALRDEPCRLLGFGRAGERGHLSGDHYGHRAVRENRLKCGSAPGAGRFRTAGPVRD